MMMDDSDQLGHTAALTFWDFDALQCIKAESRTWDAKRSEGSSSTHVNPSTAQPQTESAVLARNPWKANTLTSVTSIPHMQLRLTLGYLRSGRNVEGTEDVDLVQLGTTTEVAMLPECRVLICSSDLTLPKQNSQASTLAAIILWQIFSWSLSKGRMATRYSHQDDN